jgi:hypothetical protein
MISLMSGPWFLVLVAAAAGAVVVLRGSRIAGGALLVGAALVAAGAAHLSLPARPAHEAGGHDVGAAARDPWVLRVTLDQTAPAALPERLSERWVDVPNVGSARPDARGRIIVRGEPDAGYVQMNAVRVALRALPHVASVERIR